MAALAAAAAAPPPPRHWLRSRQHRASSDSAATAAPAASLRPQSHQRAISVTAACSRATAPPRQCSHGTLTPAASHRSDDPRPSPLPPGRSSATVARLAPSPRRWLQRRYRRQRRGCTVALPPRRHQHCAACCSLAMRASTILETAVEEGSPKSCFGFFL